MKIKFIESPNCPMYLFSGETIDMEYNGKNESIDLSDFPEGGKFESVETEIIEISGSRCIHEVKRKNGVLYVTLFQELPISSISYFINRKLIATLPADAEAPEHDKKIEHRGGNWTESDWIDSNDYEPNELYIKEVSNEG